MYVVFKFDVIWYIYFVLMDDWVSRVFVCDKFCIWVLVYIGIFDNIDCDVIFVLL